MGSLEKNDIQGQVGRLKNQSDDYTEYFIADISIEVNTVKQGDQFSEKINSIYIRRFGDFLIFLHLNEVKKNHHLYAQIILSDQVLSDYLAMFLKSSLGQKILKSFGVGSIVPSLNKQNLKSIPVVIPSIEAQRSSLLAQRKLLSLKNTIDTFYSELSLNPEGSKEMVHQLDSMLDIVGNLSDTDKLLNIIRAGESKSLEFKESLSLDIKKKTKEKYIENSALKTIVGFLNANGGTLLIGVDDDGGIKGVEQELDKFHKGSFDNFSKHLKNILKTRVGEDFYTYFDHMFININGLNILSVKCERSLSPCYLDGTDFFVRVNPATDKLEGPKLVNYVKNHFREKEAGSPDL